MAKHYSGRKPITWKAIMNLMLIRRCLAILPALLVILPVAAQPPAGIHVSGIGEVQVVPDMARLTLEVRREGEDAAGLKRELDQVTAAVLDLAKQLDIAERLVTAAAVSIYPRYPRPKDDQQPEGIIASRTIEVTVEDLEQLGELINGALERGANGVRNVQLDASNRVELERKALDLAIDDAVQEARRMAQRFEVELGPLRDASASSHQVQPMMMRMTAMAEADMAQDSIAPGEMTIRRDVQATFGIRQ
jgi:hypothetical protein